MGKGETYRDALGRPEPQATISVFGARYGRPGTGFFSLKATSDAPAKRWPYLSKDVSAIVAEMEAGGWDCSVEEDLDGAPLIRLVHRATQALLDEERNAASARFAEAEKGYIRFGDLPPGGRSTNHLDGTLEVGVSVFEAEFAGAGCRLCVDSVLRRTYFEVRTRQAYRVWGPVVGTGSDGEPVIKVTRVERLEKLGLRGIQ